MTTETRDADRLRVLAPLADLISRIIRETPIRLGPGGTDDLTAQLTVKTSVWVGKNVLPKTRGLAAFINDIDTERQRQLAKWGEQHHPDGTGGSGRRLQADRYREDCQHLADNGKTNWFAILLEEVYEAGAESDPQALRKELVQVAAVCGAWIADIDSREA